MVIPLPCGVREGWGNSKVRNQNGYLCPMECGKAEGGGKGHNRTVTFVLWGVGSQRNSGWFHLPCGMWEGWRVGRGGGNLDGYSCPVGCVCGRG